MTPPYQVGFLPNYQTFLLEDSTELFGYLGSSAYILSNSVMNLFSRLRLTSFCVGVRSSLSMEKGSGQR